ncbi:MAG: multiple sugar transport system substrate-binding protein [Thermomicrobiales bacterium]|jgi:multiple sugar transport system substrate-binding protein|nr:multiple sugar transport system substrate-binding protein [Thermomicrobiales bacterium]
MQTRITRRGILKTAAAGAAAATLPGLRPRRSFARQDVPVTLTWWDYYAEGANKDAMEAQHQRYMEAHPNVKIERTAIPFADLKQKLLQGAAAGQLPDIAVIDNPDHQAFAALGVLEDLTERVTAWGQATSYFQGPWSSTVWQDKNYGIPDNSNCLVLWYNTDFATAAGVTPPTNWEELKSAAQSLTEGDRYGLAVSAVKSEEGTFQWLPFLWETGEDIPTIDSDGGRRALQLWVDLVNGGQMSKAVLGWTQADAKTQFQNSKAAMMINGPWQIPVLEAESPDLNWNVVTLPIDKQGASILGGENYSIVKGGKNVDAAWELLTWTQTPENLKTYLLQAGKLPSRQDLAEDEAWTGDPVLKVFIEQLKVAKPRAYGDKYPQISNAIQEAIQAAVSGQTDVAAALKKAGLTIAPLLPKS